MKERNYDDFENNRMLRMMFREKKMINLKILDKNFSRSIILIWDKLLVLIFKDWILLKRIEKRKEILLEQSLFLMIKKMLVFSNFLVILIN